MKRDAIDPGAKRRLTMKIADAAENFHEDFLGQVCSLGSVLHSARQQGINRLVIACDEPRKRFVGAGSQFRDQSRLFGLERQRAGNVAHGKVRLQISVLPHYRTARPSVISKRALRFHWPIPCPLNTIAATGLPAAHTRQSGTRSAAGNSRSEE